jgi:hypothetical protein
MTLDSWKFKARMGPCSVYIQMVTRLTCYVACLHPLWSRHCTHYGLVPVSAEQYIAHGVCVTVCSNKTTWYCVFNVVHFLCSCFVYTDLFITTYCTVVLHLLHVLAETIQASSEGFYVSTLILTYVNYTIVITTITDVYIFTSQWHITCCWCL